MPLPARKPYILLTFANPLKVPEEYLKFLRQESTLVYKHLEKFAIKDQYDVNRISGITIDQLFDTIEKWQTRKDLVIFHYGGHASGEELLLNTSDGDSESAYSEGFAKLLGSLPSLRLVFLNGCSTKGQVELLLNSGVKAVIATSTSVQDKMAVDFADRFYHNLSLGESIGTSFKRSKSFLSSRYKFQVDDPKEFRKIDLSYLEDKEEVPWGIYYAESSASCLTWQLPTKPIIKSGLSDTDMYACNRAIQNSIFVEKFLSNRGEEKVQTFFIHGEEKQSPHGLFKRFVYEHIEPAYTRICAKIACIDEAKELNGAKINLLTSIFRALELEPNQFKRSELNLRTLCSAPVLKEIQAVALKIKVYSNAWKNFAQPFIEWFLEELTGPDKLDSNMPDFIFFFSIINESEANSRGKMLSKILGNSSKERIIKAAKKFDKITLLNELPPVRKIDIHKWYDRISHDPMEKEDAIKQHFPNKKKWEMVRVEKKLEEIIEEYNNRNSKL